MAVWTNEEDEKLKALYARGLSRSQMASLIDRSPNAVTGRIHRLGLNDPALSILADLVREFKKATILELSEATTFEPNEIRIILSKLSLIREHGTEEAYRPELVARMRASLMEGAEA